MTTVLKALIRQKYQLHTKAKKANDKVNWSYYRKLWNSVKNSFAKTQSQCLENILNPKEDEDGKQEVNKIFGDS